MILAALIILLVLITLFTCIQTLYLEGMRLRARDLPALQYFKSDLEPRLNLRSEEGALTFSLWKHTCLVFFGVLVMGQVIDGGKLTAPLLLESLGTAWLFLIFGAYLVPQLLFRRTSGHWIAHMLPFFGGAALVIRPLMLALNFLQSLLDITTPEEERDEPATPAENIEAL